MADVMKTADGVDLGAALLAEKLWYIDEHDYKYFVQETVMGVGRAAWVVQVCNGGSMIRIGLHDLNTLYAVKENVLRALAVKLRKQADGFDVDADLCKT